MERGRRDPEKRDPSKPWTVGVGSQWGPESPVPTSIRDMNRGEEEAEMAEMAGMAGWQAPRDVDSNMRLRFV